MLNPMRFVAPVGGGFALFALTACRNVQPAPHVVPSVSAVDVTVNVINGAAVGVGVGVASGESVIVWYGTIAGRAPHRLWPNTASAIKTPVRQNTNPIKTRGVKNAESEVNFRFMECCDLERISS